MCIQLLNPSSEKHYLEFLADLKTQDSSGMKSTRKICRSRQSHSLSCCLSRQSHNSEGLEGWPWTKTIPEIFFMSYRRHGGLEENTQSSCQDSSSNLFHFNISSDLLQIYYWEKSSDMKSTQKTWRSGQWHSLSSCCKWEETVEWPWTKTIFSHVTDV